MIKNKHRSNNNKNTLKNVKSKQKLYHIHNVIKYMARISLKNNQPGTSSILQIFYRDYTMIIFNTV